MSKRTHTVSETRDWARIVVAAGAAVAAVLAAAREIVELFV